MTVVGRARVILDGDTLALTAALKGAEAAMVQTGERMARIGRTMTTRLTLPMLAVGGMSVKMAADFDQSMRQIEGLVGIARAQLDEWEPAIRNMAAATGRSAREAAEALYFITSAGVRGSAAISTLDASLRAAAAGLGETKVVADAATSAMNAYGQANMSAERAIEIITMAVREGKMEASDLAPVMGKVIPIAAALGVEFEQVAGILAVFSRTGVDAATGATTLSALMSMMIKPSKQGADALAGVGLSFKQLRDMARGPTGLIEVIRLLDEKFGDNEEVLTQIIPNVRALRGAMNVLAQDAGTVDTMMRNVRNSQGVLDTAFGAAARGSMLQMHMAWERLKEAMLTLGKAIIPVIMPVFQKLAAVVGVLGVWFEHLSAGTKRTIVIVGGLVAALGPALLAFGLLTKAVVFLLPSLRMLPVTFKIITLTLFQFKAALAVSQAAGLGLANGLRYGLSGALTYLGSLLTPGGVILVGLGALVYLFFRAQAQAAAARREMLLATEQLEAALAASTPERAAGLITRLDGRLRMLRTRLAELEQQVNPLAGQMRTAFSPFPAATARTQDLSGALNEQARLTDALRAAEAAPLGAAITNQERAAQATRESIAEIRTQIDLYERQRTILQGIPPTPRMPSIPTTPATAGAGALTEAMQEAMDAMQEGLRQLDVMSKQMGATPFEELSGRAEIAKQAILALAGAGAKENTVLNAEGWTLRDLTDAYRVMRVEVASTTKAKSALTEASEEARRIIEATRTPLEWYNETMMNLRILLSAGALDQEHFNRAVFQAREALQSAQSAANEWGATIRQVAADSLNNFIDFTVRADQSFRDFANSVLRELQRIALKMLIMEGLKALGWELPSFSSPRKFATGGFVQPYQLAIVGEAGPELISGGRDGMRVTPLQVPSAVVSSGAVRGGDVFNINTTLAPSLIDGRSGTAWLREQRGTITEIIIDGVRRSRAARDAIVGR